MDGNTDQAQTGADQPQTADQATLQAAADQNGTATAVATPQAGDQAEGEHADDPAQADDELAAAFAAFKGEVEALKAALGIVGDRVTAVEQHQEKLEERVAALEGADLPAYNDAPLAARVTVLEAAHQAAEAADADLTALEQRVAELETARAGAPPDAEIVGKMVTDLEGRLNTLVQKLKHIL